MAYDIPDKIQYKEKIVFGLTFRQLFYACLFGLAAILSLSLPIQGNNRFVLPFVLGFVGFGFICLDLEKFFLERFAYLFNVREGGALDRRVQQFIGIRKIENDVVYLNTGEMRAIISVVPINFQNMDEARKTSVISNYRDFLNQLTHPIQILVRTVNVDLAEYYAKNDKRIQLAKNEQLKAWYEDFKVWEKKFVKENEVKERLYYVVIPYEPNNSILAQPKGIFEAIKDFIKTRFDPEHKTYSQGQDEFYRKELDGRVDLVRQSLLNSGLMTRRLTTNQLISLFMSYFDGYVEVNEDYLSPIVVAKSFFAQKGGEKNG